MPGSVYAHSTAFTVIIYSDPLPCHDGPHGMYSGQAGGGSEEKVISQVKDKDA